MKANELMIGDFFLYKENVVEVVSIDGGTETVWIDGEKVSALRKVDDLQPIPLTTEILEKNGFVKQDDGWYKITLEENNLVGVQNFENVSWIFGAIVFPNLIDHLSINYVHELQHALKLCKIEKEIEL